MSASRSSSEKVQARSDLPSPDIAHRCFEFISGAAGFVFDLGPVVIDDIDRIMKERGYLAGIGDAKLYQGEYAELRSEDILSFRDYRSPIDQKFIETLYEIREKLAKAAIEDFDFAMQKFQKDGFDRFLFMYEHSYNTSESQYMATISWAASQLYCLTGKKEYAGIAAEYIRYTIDCQEKTPLGNDLRGWFYRNREGRSIVHYTHQSREQIYMQAMEVLCRTQPGHSDRPLWEESMKLYGEYLKGLRQYTEPYGMLASGVWTADEWEDEEGFSSLHIFAPADAPDTFTAQVRNGVKIDERHYVRRFPVWLTIFNGNTAIHLSTGKAAAICGKYFKDDELMQIAAEQLYWTTGKNPFGQSLIYGEGYDYPSMSSFSSGEITGEMPVGIRSYGNEDIPFWPAVNNACYKEVWTTSAGKWLSLTSEF